MAPRAPKTDRRQRTKTIDGVTLTGHAGCWAFTDAPFEMTRAEHERRGWYLYRTDGQVQWWGDARQPTELGGDPMGDRVWPIFDTWTVVASPQSAVRRLRHLGWLPLPDGAEHRPLHHDTWLAFCGPYRLPEQLRVAA